MKNTIKAFSIKCITTGKLTDKQFDDLIENHLKLAHTGLRSECYRDYNPSDPKFYWTAPDEYSEENLEWTLYALEKFTKRYLHEQKLDEQHPEKYVTFQVIK